MDTYTISHALSCMSSSMQDMRGEINELDRQVRSMAQTIATQHPSSSTVPVPVLAAQAQPAAVDLHALRSSIEVGLRTSIRAALHSDIQQGLKDDRQLTESALMVRYDAMVCKIVKDQMSAAVAELRLALIDERPVLPPASNPYTNAAVTTQPPQPQPQPQVVREEKKKRPSAAGGVHPRAAAQQQAPIKALLRVNDKVESLIVAESGHPDLICTAEV